MSRNIIKFGVDRCPATKNYSNITFCRYCDFRVSNNRDCCECLFSRLTRQGTDKPKHLH